MFSRLTVIASAGFLMAQVVLAACSDSMLVELDSQPVAREPAPAADAPTAVPLGTEVVSPRPTPQPPNTPRPAPTVPRATSTSTPTPESTPLSLAGQIPPTATPSPTPTPTLLATPLPAAMRARLLSEIDHEYRERCRHYMREEQQPVSYMGFLDLDPDRMSDLDRVLWGGLIHDDENRIHCRDYWSEPLSTRNAHKRNESFRQECYDQLWQGREYFLQNLENYGDDEAPRFDQYSRVANWMDIPGEVLLELEPKPVDLVQEVWERIHVAGEDIEPSVEWYGLLDGASYDSGAWPDNDLVVGPQYGRGYGDSCVLYYPQLFTGRWVPFDTATTRQAMQMSHLSGNYTPTPVPHEMGAWINQRDRPVFIVR